MVLRWIQHAQESEDSENIKSPGRVKGEEQISASIGDFEEQDQGVK